MCVRVPSVSCVPRVYTCVPRVSCVPCASCTECHVCSCTPVSCVPRVYECVPRVSCVPRVRPVRLVRRNVHAPTKGAWHRIVVPPRPRSDYSLNTKPKLRTRSRAEVRPSGLESRTVRGRAWFGPDFLSREVSKVPDTVF